MTIAINNEENYAAFVVRVPELRKAANSDRLHILATRGISVVVNDSWLERVGTLAVIFPTEAQIAFEIARTENLHRNSALNADQSVKGYMDDKRRVRAVRLRGNMSSGLALPLEALTGLFGESPDLVEGVTFDTLNGHEVTRKYVVPVKAASLSPTQQKIAKAFKRVDEKIFPMHVSTSFWERNLDKVSDSQTIIVTQKLHGTSVRFGNVPVKVEHTWLERLAQKFGVRVKQFEFDTIAGSRKVIKDPKATGQNHYYNSDVWTKAMHDYAPNLPENFVVYGELVGFVGNDGPIQKGYTYEALPGETDFYVYRVAFVNERGFLVDLSWDQVKEFAAQYGMAYTPELWRGPKAALVLDMFKEANFRSVHDNVGAYTDRPVGLSAGGTGIDEGIVIRVETGERVPDLYKFKNDSFYEFESKELDTGEENIEG